MNTPVIQYNNYTSVHDSFQQLRKDVIDVMAHV
jgi:hypothetical protein